MIKKYLEAGQIVGTHGVKGEMRVNPWCDSPEFLNGIKTFYLDKNGNAPIAVQSIRPHGNVVLVMLSGINSIEDAQKMRNKILYIDRADKPLGDGQNYIEDLIGCKVFDVDDQKIKYGEITDVITGVANDVWTIKSENGKETLIPAIKDVIIKTDTQNGMVFIRPLKGLFTDECIIREDDE